jgi:hypothetical protein
MRAVKPAAAGETLGHGGLSGRGGQIIIAVMKLDSPWFDSVRAAPKGPRAAPCPKRCEHAGCGQPGGFRAPKGRGREGQYWNFCYEHVRAYNQTYNYFADMPDEAVAAYQRAAATTGHRPTWTMGVNPARRSGDGRGGTTTGPRPLWEFLDPFEFFDLGGGPSAEPPPRERRPIRKVERNALDELGLDETATATEIKARFKLLAKRLHPDTNGGNRDTEDKLRAVIQAYGYLKQAGLC